jgi:hypothetical protein
MNEIVQATIMVDRRVSVDYAMRSKPRIRLDYCTGQHNRAGSKIHASVDAREWMYDS